MVLQDGVTLDGHGGGCDKVQDGDVPEGAMGGEVGASWNCFENLG